MKSQKSKPAIQEEIHSLRQCGARKVKQFPQVICRIKFEFVKNGATTVIGYLRPKLENVDQPGSLEAVGDIAYFMAVVDLKVTDSIGRAGLFWASSYVISYHPIDSANMLLEFSLSNYVLGQRHEDGVIPVTYAGIKKQFAGMLANPLGEPVFRKFRKKEGLSFIVYCRVSALSPFQWGC